MHPIHQIELADDPRLLFIDGQEAKKANEILQRRYGIPVK
jgi:hypothetical protein